MNINDNNGKKGAILGTLTIVVVILLSIWLVGLTNVGAGERAVIFHRDGSMDVLQPGKWQFVMPFVNSVDKYNVQQKTVTVDLDQSNSAATIDGQDVYGKVVVLYHPDPTQIAWIHQNLGKDYAKKIVGPAINEAVKANTVKFKAPELFRNRPTIEADVHARLQERLTTGHLVLDQVSIVNMHFDKTYEDQITKSQAAEQQLVLEQNKLAIARLQANQTIEAARGQAEAQRLLSTQGGGQQSLDYLMFMEWVKKWDGKLPAWLGQGGDSSVLVTPPSQSAPTASSK